MVKILSTCLLLLLVQNVMAQDEIELKITTIKGNKELPKILYLVLWKDIKRNKKAERKLVLHSLFGDLFDPVLPSKAVVSASNDKVNK